MDIHILLAFYYLLFNIVPTFICFHVQILSHVTSLMPQSSLQEKDNTCHLIDVLEYFHTYFSAMLILPVFHGNWICDKLLNECAVKLFYSLSTIKVLTFAYSFICQITNILEMYSK